MYHTKDEALLRTLHHLVLTIQDLRHENAQMRNFLSSNFRQYTPSNNYSQDANFSTMRAFIQEFEALSQTNRGHANLLKQESPYEENEYVFPPRPPLPPGYDSDNPFY